MILCQGLTLLSLGQGREGATGDGERDCRGIGWAWRRGRRERRVSRVVSDCMSCTLLYKYHEDRMRNYALDLGILG